MQDDTTKSTDTTDTEIANINSLSGMITKAAAALARATTAAEVFDVIQNATVVYDAARITARLKKARDAHAEIITACHKAMGDALEIEAAAKCKLADEYDAAQARGEVATHSAGNPQIVPNQNDLPLTAAQVGLSRKIVHEARKVRDAERKSPGIIRKTLSEQLSKGEAPTRADINRAITPKRTVAAAPPNTFAPRAAAPEPAVPVTPEPAADDEIDYRDEPDCETHLGLHVYAGFFSNGDVRIYQDGDDPVFLTPGLLQELVDWLEDNDLVMPLRGPPRETDASSPPTRCSFCSKPSSEVETLIRGASNITALICNECVSVCVEVIEQRRENEQ